MVLLLSQYLEGHIGAVLSAPQVCIEHTAYALGDSVLRRWISAPLSGSGGEYFGAVNTPKNAALSII